MRKVELRMNIQVPPAVCLAALITPADLANWWNVERCLIELKKGGVYTLVWGISEFGFTYVTTGIIHEYKPGKILDIRQVQYLNPEKEIFGSMRVIFRVEEMAGNSELYICQDGYGNGGDWDWYFESVSAAWPKVAEQLKEHLEKHK